MGAKILTTLAVSLFMMAGVDIFIEWYGLFLERRGLNPHLIRLLKRTTLVILAFIFWRAIVARQVQSEFAPTHFFFALFIYCFYKLIVTFFKKNQG